MATGDGERGWFFPSSARKCHFDGGDGIALCGKWARGGFGGYGIAPIQAGADAAPSPDDCASCRRKVDALNAKEQTHG